MGRHSLKPQPRHRGKRSPSPHLNKKVERLLLAVCVGSTFAIGVVSAAPQEPISVLSLPIDPTSPITTALVVPQPQTQSPLTSSLPTPQPGEKDAPVVTSEAISEPVAPSTTSPPTRTTTPPPSRTTTTTPITTPAPPLVVTPPAVVQASVKCNGLGVTQAVKDACNQIVGSVSGIGAIGGTAQRAGASCHPLGLALDLTASTPVGNAIADYALSHKAELSITYVIWRQRINYGAGWEPMPDRGGITANHYDHVHISFKPCNV